MTFDDDGPLSGAGALPRVQGAGGGGGKSGGGSASSAPDTLFSTATVRLVDLLGEGEIVGVRGGLKGVYLNDVPVQNADDSFNFKGLTAEFRVGTPDQPYMAGYPDVQTPNNVGIKVNQATPVTVSISDTDVDRLRVTIHVPSLFLAKSDGSVRANSVSYRILARYSGGQWVNALGDQTITGKTTSGYFRSHEIALPINPNGASAPWQVQVIRLSPDTDDFNNSQAKFTNQSDLVFHSTTSIVDARFGYPHSAMVGLTAQASSFGSSVPGRTYLVDGVLMPIPSNYDPVARTYSGVWDGTFKEGFSNNPAWALNLILRNDRFGLGEFIDVAAIDKWSLYEIGRYCDVLVSDGKGGQEPRYVFNGAISTQQEAFELLQLIAQVFRGTVYWSSGTVTAAQDRPADPVLLVTEANALEGENGEVFSYASSGRRSRHTVAIVAWNDPDNLYKQALEVVEDPEGVARYGYNPTKIDLLGCTSRGQAHRAGLWTLFTELHQTQVLTYRAGLDHAVIRPGDIVAVQDPQISNLDLSGRLKDGATASRLVLDRPVTLASGAGYSISVVLPDGTVQEREIATGAGETDVVTLAAPLSQVPDPAAVWLITGPVEPQLFRIVSIREEEPHIYAVAALQHEPGKYATIDDGAAFEPSVISEFPTIVLPPTNLTVRESQYTELGQPKQAITLSWTAGQPFNSVAYYVTVIRPSGATVTTRTASQSIDFMDAEVGDWTFVVTAIGLNGKNSLPAQTTYTLAGWAGQAPTMVAGLSVKGGGSTFSGRSCTVTWANQIAATVPPYPVRNAVYIFDASTQALVHREVLPAGVTEWTYDYFLNVNEGGPRRQFRVGVSAQSAGGDEGPVAYLTVSNPPPAIIAPTLSATSEILFVELPPVTDRDFAGYLVWVSEAPGINPLTATPYDVTNSLFTFAGTADKTYYVRAAAYDAFGKNPAELNVSTEQSKKLTILLFDPLAPGIPPQPTIVSNVAETAPDGTVTSKATIGWGAVTTANLGLYEGFLAEGTNPAESAYVGGRRTTANALAISGLMPGRAYSFKVRTASKNGFAVSGFSPVLTFTAAANTTAPANPTGFTATAAFQGAQLKWTAPTTADLAHVEVWGFDGNSTAATPPAGSVLIDRVGKGTTGYADRLPTTGTRTYWLRSVNTSGVVATGYVRAPAVTTAALTAAALQAGIIDRTMMASGLEIPRVVAALPATKDGQFVTLSSDGKLYRWDQAQAKYVSASLQISEITGLTKEQIVSVNAAAIAGQVGADQIGAGSVNFEKFAAGLSPIVDVSALPAVAGYTGSKVVRLITDGKLYRLVGSTWTAGVTAGDITGTIASTQITDSAISSPKLAANAVTAGKIDANAITAREIVAGTITATELAAGAVAADKILANAIISEKIAANAITGSKLAIASSNAAFNSDYAQGTLGWSVFSSNPGGSGNVGYIEHANDVTFAPAGMTSLRTRTTDIATATTGYYEILSSVVLPDGTSTDYTVAQSQRFEISAYISAHRCLARFVIQFFNSAGASISEAALPSAVSNYGIAGTAPLSDWDAAGRICEFVTTPAGATKMRVRIRVQGFQTGQSQPPVCFVSGLMIAPAYSATLTEPSPYVPGGITSIDGSGIITNSITARAIAANTITAAEIAADTITATQIKGRTITANEIATGTITGNEIKADAITAAKIAAGAVGADQIAAGAIVADKIGVGLNTGNLIWNSDFGVDGWYRNPPGGAAGATAGLRGQASNYVVSGVANALQLFNASGVADTFAYTDLYFPQANGSQGSLISVQGGKTYEFSAYLSAHRCRGYVQIIPHDGTAYLSGYTTNTIEDLQGSGAPNDSWRARCKMTMPANAKGVTIRIFQRYHTTNVGGGAYVMVSGLYLGLVPNGTPADVYSDYAPQSATVISGGQLATNSITAREIAAGTITSDHISVTGKIQAGKIQIDGTNGLIRAINLNAERITADSIQVGNGSLDTLFAGTNSTKIVGGALAANSITADRLMIASRQMTVLDLNFEMERNATTGVPTNVLKWSAGFISYIDDNGAAAGRSIAAGSIATQGTETHVWWVKGASALSAARGGSDLPMGADKVPMAAYSSAMGLNVLKGGSIIDGTRISANSIQALQIAANQIQTDHMAANSISGDRITAGTLAADKIAAGTITAGTINLGPVTGAGRLTLEAPDNRSGRIYSRDTNSRLRAMLGYIGDQTGVANDFGLILWNAAGQQILTTTSGLAANTVGDVQISSVSASKISATNLSSVSANLGTVTAGVARSTDSKFIVDFTNKRILISD